jgi:hypothetical protein
MPIGDWQNDQKEGSVGILGLKPPITHERKDPLLNGSFFCLSKEHPAQKGISV